MPSQYGFVFDHSKCIQCHSCEVACKSWRDVELGIHWRRVNNIWKNHYPEVTCLSVSVACMHCVEPECIKACPEEAIQKLPDNGVVVVDRDKCIGCQTCLDACPFGIPQFGEDEKMQKCDLCVHEIDYQDEVPPCVRACPTEALLFEEMAVERKKKMEKFIEDILSSDRE
jgi:anaerobic dimethyl sulfoxide reductase subunit B (iron-sulfur subunit)